MAKEHEKTMKSSIRIDTYFDGGIGFLTLFKDDVRWFHDAGHLDGRFIDIGTTCGIIRLYPDSKGRKSDEMREIAVRVYGIENAEELLNWLGE